MGLFSLGFNIPRLATQMSFPRKRESRWVVGNGFRLAGRNDILIPHRKQRGSSLKRFLNLGGAGFCRKNHLFDSHNSPVSKSFLLFVLVLILFSASLLSGCQSTASPSSTVETGSSAAGLIKVVSASAEIDFPKSLTFNLEVESASDITGIELRYKIIKITSVSVTTTIKPDFEEYGRVRTGWTWDTRKASLPPGAEVEYRWIIRNAVGDRFETESSRITFADSRYNWQDLTEGDVGLFWYDGDKSFARELMDAAQAGLNKLAADTGARLETPVKIYVYDDAQALQGALVFPQEWTGGVAFTEYGIIAIGIPPGNLAWGKRVIAHELVHMVMHQVTFNPYSGLPTWLDEGLAMYAEGELRQDMEDALPQAISDNALFSVRSLQSSFPANAGEAMIAYAESYSLVKWLIDTYGSDTILELLEVFKDGSSVDDALLEVYGFDSDGLESLWRSSLGLGTN